MKSIIVSIVLSVFIVATGFNAFGEDWTAEQKEVWSVVEQYFNNLVNGDVASTMALIHDNSLELFSGKAIPLKKDQIKNEYYGFVNIKPTIEVKPISIAVIDQKVANAFYYFKWKGEDGIYSAKGRSMQTFIKQGDKWISTGSISSKCSEPPFCPSTW